MGGTLCRILVPALRYDLLYIHMHTFLKTNNQLNVIKGTLRRVLVTAVCYDLLYTYMRMFTNQMS